MDILLDKFKEVFEEKVIIINKERAIDSLPPLPRANIKILGQVALQVYPGVSDALHLVRTRDFDALLEGDWSIRSIIRECIAELGLMYDELSREIWIPPHAKFEVFYESLLLKIEVLEPIAVLTSKAVKAPEKNKFLLQQAIAHYGEKLVTQIEFHGGNIKFILAEGKK